MNNKDHLANMIIASGKFEYEKEYWKTRLGDKVVISNLPYNKNRKNRGQKIFSYCFLDEIYNGIKKLANDSNMAVYTILLTAMEVLMYRYNYNKYITIGIPTIQSKAEEDNINELLPFILTMDNDNTLKDVLIKTKEGLKADYKYQKYPYYKMLSEKEINFNTVVLLEEIHNLDKLNSIGVETLFSFSVKNSALELVVSYSDNKYSKEAIEQFCRHFEKILYLILNQISLTVDTIDLLSEEEKHKLLLDFNNTEAAFYRDKTIYELFEENVEKYSDNTAVVCDEQELSYRELNERANSLARTLITYGVTKESIVGIMLNRSVEMIIAMLAILKTGGAYLPIDPEYPEDRIKYMLQDSKTILLLSEKKLIERINYEGKYIDVKDKESYVDNKDNIGKVNLSENLAYIIYTSGTTGKPKGVMVEHKGILSLIEVFRNELSISSRKEDTSICKHFF